MPWVTAAAPPLPCTLSSASDKGDGSVWHARKESHLRYSMLRWDFYIKRTSQTEPSPLSSETFERREAASPRRMVYFKNAKNTAITRKMKETKWFQWRLWVLKQKARMSEKTMSEMHSWMTLS